MKQDIYELIIVGGSVAAATAAIYAARRNLKCKVLAKDFGGEVATSGEIGNWPGIPTTDGITLSNQFREHMEFYKVDMQDGVWVKSIEKQNDGNFLLKVDMIGDGSDKNVEDFFAKSVIIATGVHPRELGIKGEKELRGKGVSYCTVCDGPLFGGQDVAVIGGGNSALESALMLADLANKVYVINKNKTFNGEQVLIDKLTSKTNVEIVFEANVHTFVGSELLEKLIYKNKEGDDVEVAVQGTFVHIGMIPNSDVVSDTSIKNQFGEIVVNMNAATTIPGLFAAGDVTNIPFKQIVIAAGQGCTAALSAVNYLNNLQS